MLMDEAVQSYLCSLSYFSEFHKNLLCFRYVQQDYYLKYLCVGFRRQTNW